MPKLPRISSAQLLRALRRAGFVEARQQGSHLTVVHPDTHLTLTIPMNRDPLRTGTLAAILRQADIRPDQLRDLLGR